MTVEKQTNTVVPLRTADIIGQEAADWLVKLDNKLDGKHLCPDDLDCLHAWLAQDSRHGQTLKRQADIWRDMDIYAQGILDADCQTDESLWSLILQTKAFRNSLALACTLVISMVFWFYSGGFGAYNNEPNLYSTKVGSQTVEVLSDGSVAHLNTDSLIEVEFSDAERRIILLRGEAMFDVAHNPNRPFIVYADGRTVKAIGTRFIVRLTSEKILVVVAEGQVQLNSQPKPPGEAPIDQAVSNVQEVILLSQGQTAEMPVDRFEKPVLNEVNDKEFQQKFSWINGKLIFVNETLATIIDEISRYTGVRVVIVDPELESLRLSGRFQIGDTEALLEAIEISKKNIQVSRNSDGSMVYISKKSG